MSKDGNTVAARPLNARSIALSALLGTHPPTLTAGALVSLAELFGVSGSTMRTALSRMVAAGDLTVRDARYSLTPRLLARQAAQDAGRRRATAPPWTGAWHTAVAVAGHRTLADRRQVRVIMANARFGELQPTVWLRPANLPAPELDADWLVSTGDISGQDPLELVARIWDLPLLAESAARLERRLAEAATTTVREDPSTIPAAFTLSAEVLRFLRSEPLLPAELTPADWPVDRLRERYGVFERELQARLRPILAGVRSS